MSEKLSYDSIFKNDYIQPKLFLAAQILWILIYIGVSIALIVKTQVSGKKIAFYIGFLIIIIVFTIFCFYLITKYCKDGQYSAAWIITFLPYIAAPSIGYDLVSKLIKKNERMNKIRRPDEE